MDDKKVVTGIKVFEDSPLENVEKQWIIDLLNELVEKGTIEKKNTRNGVGYRTIVAKKKAA